MTMLTISDFSGGLTDSTFTSDLNCGERIDNFLIRKDRTLETVPGMEVLTPRLPTGKRVAAIAKLTDGNYVAFSNKKAYYVTTTTVTEIKGPTLNSAFSVGDENSVVSLNQSLGHIYATTDARPFQIKIYIDDTNTPQLRTAGLKKVASDPSITITGSGTGTSGIIYAFTYYYEYRVGTTLFVDESTPRFVNKTLANASFTSASITGIPVLSNGLEFNWDTTKIKVRIWRTNVNGQTLYHVGDVTNGTTTFSDTVLDATLITNETLYTTGGVRGNDLPDPSKFIFEAADTQFALNIYQASEERPFRLKQSITNDPDSVPDDFITDFRGTLMGGGAVGRSPVVFTDTQTIRLDGLLDETGKGVTQKEVLSNTIGSISHNGVVKGNGLLYFPGPNSFYRTDGFSPPVKLALEQNTQKSKLDGIYPKFTTTDEQKKRIYGAYDALNGRVFWLVQQEESDNDRIYVYHEAHDSFSTLSNTAGILPTSILVDEGDIILGDSNGYIFRMSAENFTHPVVDTSKAPSLWVKAPIIYSWKSVQITAGDGSINKWFIRTNVQGNPTTNVNMAIRSYANGEPEFKELYPVRVTTSLTWGDPDFTWGDDSFAWNRTGTLDQTRRFPAGRLRARQRQLEFTNAYYTIISSTADSASYVTVNASAKIATLVNPSSYSFGLNTEGYDMIINGIAYTILTGTADTLTLSGPSGTLVNGTHAWSIMGYGKGQRAHILNFSIEFEEMNNAGTQWHGAPTK